MSHIKTYSEQIIEHIKKMLLQGDLQPGDKVNEVHLASVLSISRAPIREALQTLAQEGLLVSIPQRGKFIKALSPDEIKDGYYIGGVLEGAAVGSNIDRFTHGDFTFLKSCIEEMKQLDVVENYPDAFTRVDVRFHDRLVSYSDNKLICEYSRSICQRMSKFLLFHHWPHCFTQEEVVTRHQQILEALLTKNVYLVETTIRNHYAELGIRMMRFGCGKPPYELP